MKSEFAQPNNTENFSVQKIDPDLEQRKLREIEYLGIVKEMPYKALVRYFNALEEGPGTLAELRDRINDPKVFGWTVRHNMSRLIKATADDPDWGVVNLTDSDHPLYAIETRKLLEKPTSKPEIPLSQQQESGILALFLISINGREIDLEEEKRYTLHLKIEIRDPAQRIALSLSRDPLLQNDQTYPQAKIQVLQKFRGMFDRAFRYNLPMYSSDTMSFGISLEQQIKKNNGIKEGLLRFIDSELEKLARHPDTSQTKDQETMSELQSQVDLLKSNFKPTEAKVETQPTARPAQPEVSSEKYGSSLKREVILYIKKHIEILNDLTEAQFLSIIRRSGTPLTPEFIIETVQQLANTEKNPLEVYQEKANKTAKGQYSGFFVIREKKMGRLLFKFEGDSRLHVRIGEYSEVYDSNQKWF
jgi:hypothetical protein